MSTYEMATVYYLVIALVVMIRLYTSGTFSINCFGHRLNNVDSIIAIGITWFPMLILILIAFLYLLVRKEKEEL